MNIEIPSNISLEQYQSTLEHCLKEKYGFFERVIYNICDGTQHVVPHGFWDYAIMVGLLLLVGGFVLIVFIAILKLMFD